MSRVRRTVRCAICGQEPQLGPDGRWLCECPKMDWTPRKGFAGTDEDRALLEHYGWRMVTDSTGFVYWVGGAGTGVVSLYPDGTWAGGPPQFDELEDFLKWFAALQPQRK